MLSILSIKLINYFLRDMKWIYEKQQNHKK